MNVFARILATVPRIDKKNLQRSKNNLQNPNKKTVNAIKPISKTANERFCLYLDNDTSHRLKTTSRVLKIEQRIP